MSTVTRGENQERPSWEYAADRDNPGASRLDILEMLESIRNVLEEIRDDQRKSLERGVSR